MQVPLEVYFHNTDKSDAIEAIVRERARTLERYADTIVSCRVTIEAPHKHHHQGKLFRVTVDLHVPGAHIVVNRDPSQHHAHEDVSVAIHDAFDAARRQLQDHFRVVRGKVKAHEEQPHGRIVELVPAQDFGRIETVDGREVYFHRNSVLNADFDKLETGMRVRFDEERGDQGPQASTVHVIS
jgi:cold shock CspA family protein/ribosome-associated translation inhibitor RaiA